MNYSFHFFHRKSYQFSNCVLKYELEQEKQKMLHHLSQQYEKLPHFNSSHLFLMSQKVARPRFTSCFINRILQSN